MNNNDSGVKKAAIQFDVFLRDGGIGAALFFCFVILVFVNAHSLSYLLGRQWYHWLFSSLGAIGLSVATLVIIRKSANRLMQYLFPVFDTLLVFLGLNIEYQTLGNDTTRLIMTGMMAVFIGLILYSIGHLNTSEHIHEDNHFGELNKMKSENEHLCRQLNESNSFAKKMEAELNESKKQIQELDRIKEQSDSFTDKMKTELNESKKKIHELERIKEQSNSFTDKMKAELNESKKKIHELERIKEQSNQLLSDSNRQKEKLANQLNESNNKLNESNARIVELDALLNESKSIQNESEAASRLYYKNHIHWLAFLEKKKKPGEREMKLIEESAKLKNVR